MSAPNDASFRLLCGVCSVSALRGDAIHYCAVCDRLNAPNDAPTPTAAAVNDAEGLDLDAIDALHEHCIIRAQRTMDAKSAEWRRRARALSALVVRVAGHDRAALLAQRAANAAEIERLDRDLAAADHALLASERLMSDSVVRATTATAAWRREHSEARGNARLRNATVSAALAPAATEAPE